MRFIIGFIFAFTISARARPDEVVACASPLDAPIPSMFDARMTLVLKKINSHAKYKAFLGSPEGQHFSAEPFHAYRSDWRGWTFYFGKNPVVTMNFDETIEWGEQHQIVLEGTWMTAFKAGHLPAGMLTPKSISPELFAEYLAARAKPPEQFAQFARVKDWVRERAFANMAEFRMAVQRGEAPAGTPKYPEFVYRDEWRTAAEFLVP